MTREGAGRRPARGLCLPHGRRKDPLDMSITVNIYYAGRDGSARTFAEEMVSSGIVSRVRAEEGNERYEYFFPMYDPETVLLIDRWRDEEAVRIHHKSEMMVEIAALRDKYRLHMRIERFTDAVRS